MLATDERCDCFLDAAADLAEDPNRRLLGNGGDHPVIVTLERA
jgi:hypothetical protein